MLERYHYPPSKIVFPYSLLLLMPALGIYGWLMGGLSIDKIGFPLGIFFWLFILVPTVSIICWIVNNISVKIEISEVGISYQSMMKNLMIAWNDVTELQRRILYERRGWHDDPQGANDLLVKLHNGGKIKIYGIVRRCDGIDGGVAELENLIREKVCLENFDQDKQKEIASRHQWRLCIVAGLLCSIFGILMWAQPSPYEREILWFISKRINISADAFFLVVGGLGMSILAIYKLKAPLQ